MTKTPREVGEIAGNACLGKAQAVAEFNADAARTYIAEWLRIVKRAWSEDLTDEAMKAGYVPHDARAFGPIFQSLLRAKQIKCIGYGQRRKGRGTAGSRLYEAVL